MLLLFQFNVEHAHTQALARKARASATSAPVAARNVGVEREERQHALPAPLRGEKLPPHHLAKSVHWHASYTSYAVNGKRCMYVLYALYALYAQHVMKASYVMYVLYAMYAW